VHMFILLMMGFVRRVGVHKRRAAEHCNRFNYKQLFYDCKNENRRHNVIGLGTDFAYVVQLGATPLPQTWGLPVH
jgi:hypothetical protein